MCSKEFNPVSDLDNHTNFLAEKRHKCNTCDKSFSSTNSLNSHMIQHEKKQTFKCGTCGQEFCDKSALKNHLDSHSSEESCVCEICNKGFPCTTTLGKHKRMHLEKKPFECKLCDTGFPNLRKLDKHMIIHTDGKHLECKECGKRFTTAHNLNEHTKSHTGEKPFTCELCGKCFSQNSNLKTHKKTHTGEKPHECTVCERKFGRKSTLLEHIKMHKGEKPFSCNFCGKSFVNKSTCDTHMKAHIRVQKHQCSICLKGFYNKNSLKGHIRREHEEKTPFECTECGKKFKYNSYLVRHMATHANKSQTQDVPIVLRSQSLDCSLSGPGNDLYLGQPSGTSVGIQEADNSLKCQTCGKILSLGVAEHQTSSARFNIKCKDCDIVEQETSLEMEENNVEQSEYSAPLEFVTCQYDEAEEACKMESGISESLAPDVVKSSGVFSLSEGTAEKDPLCEEADMTIFPSIDVEEEGELKVGVSDSPKDTQVDELVKEELLENVHVKEEVITTWDYV